MGKKDSRKVSFLKRFQMIVKNGMFLFGLTNRLSKLGICIEPYYWVREENEPCDKPKVKGGDSGFVLRYLGKDELNAIRSYESDDEFNEMVKGMERGQLCLGLEKNNEIAAYTFAELNDFEFKGRKFTLKPTEAYLLNMWTFHQYRGRNLAPYLRYKTYKILKEQGIDVNYSITNYFNKSSARFKKKLNSKNLYLYLSIELFKKFRWNFTLKKY